MLQKLMILFWIAEQAMDETEFQSSVETVRSDGDCFSPSREPDEEEIGAAGDYLSHAKVRRK